MTQVRRTAEERSALANEIIDLTMMGATPFQIAVELEVSVPYVYQLLKSRGIKPVRIPRDNVAEEVVKDIIDTYLGGEVLRPLLNKHGITYSQMYTILAHAGIDPAKRYKDVGMARSKAADTAISMYEKGAKLKEIAATTGIYAQTLMLILRRHKIPTRREIRDGVMRKGENGEWEVVIDPDP